MSVSGEQPGAREAQRQRIITWHAQGHDALDRYGIPRIADGLWYTLAERVDMLAQGAGIEATPRTVGIVAPDADASAEEHRDA